MLNDLAITEGRKPGGGRMVLQPVGDQASAL